MTGEHDGCRAVGDPGQGLDGLPAVGGERRDRAGRALPSVTE